MSKVLAICGVSVLCAGVGLGLLIHILGFKASSLDSPLVNPFYCGSGGVQCAPPPPFPSCSKKALFFQEINAFKVMSVSESQKLTTTLVNWGEKECKVSITLDAPNFTTSSEKKQTFVIPRFETTEFNWVLSCDKPGTYTVIVSITTADDPPKIIGSNEIGISVTNIFGLTASQASLFSVVSGAFGSILTVPFWLDRCKKRKGKENIAESKDES